MDYIAAISAKSSPRFHKFAFLLLSGQGGIGIPVSLETMGQKFSTYVASPLLFIQQHSNRTAEIQMALRLDQP
jgi:hypothetical protein